MYLFCDSASRQQPRKGILRNEAAVLRRVVSRPQILQSGGRVVLLAVVAVEWGLDAVFVCVDVAIRIVGVALRYRTLHLRLAF